MNVVFHQCLHSLAAQGLRVSHTAVFINKLWGKMSKQMLLRPVVRSAWVVIVYLWIPLNGNDVNDIRQGVVQIAELWSICNSRFIQF